MYGSSKIKNLADGEVVKKVWKERAAISASRNSQEHGCYLIRLSSNIPRVQNDKRPEVRDIP